MNHPKIVVQNRIQTLKLMGLAFMLSMFFTHCSEVETPRVVNEDYYPLAVGNAWIYDVDSVIFNEFTKDSTRFVFERKEEITSSFKYDSINTTIYLISVSVRKDTLVPWTLLKTHRVESDSAKLILKIDNTPFVKLIYPVKDLISWDQNQMNTLGADMVRYRNVGLPTVLSALSFDQTLMVDQRNEKNPFETNIRWEKYANNVGLIEKYIENTKLEAKVKSGVRCSWKLKSFIK